MISSGGYDQAVLEQAVSTTFKNRKTQYVPKHTLFTTAFASEIDRNRTWQSFLRKIGQAMQLSFPMVMAEIRRVLQPVWESLSIEKQ